MKVFISWSGELSQKLGNELKEWIPDVLQAVQPYFTPEDIQKGERWSSEIAKELEASLFGIFCVTSENLDSGWMHFEAGAISKNKTEAQVCPILFDLRPTDMKGPLQQFQLTVFAEDDIRKLMKTINAKLGDHAIAEERLERQFSKCWPSLKGNIEDILANRKKTPKKPMRSDRDLLEEILLIVRESQKNEQNIKMQSEIMTLSREVSAEFYNLTLKYMELYRYFIDGNADFRPAMDIFVEIQDRLLNLNSLLPMPDRIKKELYDRIVSLKLNKSGSPF